jgi:hypothetical protein
VLKYYKSNLIISNEIIKLGLPFLKVIKEAPLTKMDLTAWNSSHDNPKPKSKEIATKKSKAMKERKQLKEMLLPTETMPN